MFAVRLNGKAEFEAISYLKLVRFSTSVKSGARCGMVEGEWGGVVRGEEGCVLNSLLFP